RRTGAGALPIVARADPARGRTCPPDGSPRSLVGRGRGLVRRDPPLTGPRGLLRGSGSQIVDTALDAAGQDVDVLQGVPVGREPERHGPAERGTADREPTVLA